MKEFFKLFRFNMKDVWKNNKFLFLLIMGFMFFSFVFIGLSISFINNILYDEYDNNLFSFRVKSLENIEQKLDKLLNENNEIDCIFFSFECPNLIEENTATVYALYSGNLNEKSNVSIGNWFSSSQMENGENVIIVPNYNYYKKRNYHKTTQKYEIGTNFDINGTNYTIIGESNINEYVFIIPYKSIQNKYQSMNVNISLNDTLTKSENKKFVKNVVKNIDCGIIKIANPRSISIELFSKMIFIVIFSVQIIDLIFVYKYLLDQRAMLIESFKIHKINKGKAVNYLFFEYMLWLLICFIISSLLVSLFLFIASSTKLNFLHTIDWWEYLVIFAFSLIVYGIVFFITIESWIYRKDQKNWEIEE